MSETKRDALQLGQTAINGKVRIVKDGMESYVLPESVPVWTERGWKADPGKASDQKPKTTEVQTVEGEKVTIPTGE